MSVQALFDEYVQALRVASYLHEAEQEAMRDYDLAQAARQNAEQEAEAILAKIRAEARKRTRA